MPMNNMASKIARRCGFDPVCMFPDRGILQVVTRYANQNCQMDSPVRTHGPQLLPQPHTYRHLDPVGIETMPSQSVHIPEQLYEYVITTKADEQSTSARVTELVRKGKAKEETQ